MEIYGISLVMGHAGFISSTIGSMGLGFRAEPRIGKPLSLIEP